MLDILNIVWPVVSSTGITGVIIFLFKKNIERKIEHRFKKIEITQKLYFEETYRRQSKLFDEQFSSYKILSATTYRLKNSSRTLFEMVSNGVSGKSLVNELKIFKSCESLLSETMYADKLIIEDSAFSIIHDLKHACVAFIHKINHYEIKNDIKELDSLKKLLDKIENAHFEALSMYKQSIEAPPSTLLNMN